jgi:hypothetical protein
VDAAIAMRYDTTVLTQGEITVVAYGATMKFSKA